MSQQNTQQLNPIAITLARLADLGCINLDQVAVAAAWQGPLHAELEFRVGGRLSSGMTNTELEEFEALLDRNAGDDAAASWLAEHAPDYRDIVREELAGLIDESVAWFARTLSGNAEGDRR